MKNRAIAVTLIGLFIIFTPILFLSQLNEGPATVYDMPYQVVRVGQSFTSIILKDVSVKGEQRQVPSSKMNSSGFIIDLPYPVSYDELEAITDAISTIDIQKKYAHATRVRFLGWSPAIFPIRIQYRYFIVLGFSLILFGIGMFLCRLKITPEK